MLNCSLVNIVFLKKTLETQQKSEVVSPAVSPDQEKLQRLNESYLAFRTREFGRGSLLAELRKLIPWIKPKEEEEVPTGGWPLENGCWDFSLVERIWSLLIAAQKQIKKSNYFEGYEAETLKKLILLTNSDAQKLRSLVIEAVYLHNLIDQTMAGGRKHLVQKELFRFLPKDLICLTAVYGEILGDEIVDSNDPDTLYKEGSVYSLDFNDEKINAYCLGMANNEPFFELDVLVLPQITDYRLGSTHYFTFENNNPIEVRFIGLTMSGKPVYSSNNEIIVGGINKEFK